MTGPSALSAVPDELVTESPPTTDWIAFLHLLGRVLIASRSEGKERLDVILVLPVLDYGSVIVASGAIAQTVMDSSVPVADASEWGKRPRAPVSFLCQQRDSQKVKRMRGEISGIDHFRGKERLLVRWLETDRSSRSRAVPDKWIGLIQPLETDELDLECVLQGSLILENVAGLEAMVGIAGVHALLKGSQKLCLMVDVRSRVEDELKTSLALDRIGRYSTKDSVALRDIVRLDTAGPEAMRTTSCCRVFNKTEPGWPITIFAGSLNFIRHWDDSDSPVRIAIISPIENSFGEAIESANRLFEQRSEIEFTIPESLLAAKPAGIDIQIFHGA